VVTVEREIRTSADSVWHVLADGWLYASWVVGASRMRAVEPTWPAVGAVLHHSQGAWPLLLDDETVVKASVPGRELVLHGKTRPLGEVAIRLRLEPSSAGCRVVLEEDAIRGPMQLIPAPVRAALIRPRNSESLRRLAYLAEGGSR
jgi:hypothetical protein